LGGRLVVFLTAVGDAGDAASGGWLAARLEQS